MEEFSYPRKQTECHKSCFPLLKRQYQLSIHPYLLHFRGNGLIGTAATDADGHLHHSFPNSQYTLEGLHSIIGRSIVVSIDIFNVE